jgi:hypothetical protein
MSRIAWALLLALAGGYGFGQDAVHVRPGIVSSPDGAPIVLEGSETIDGRVHARATVRNESEVPLTRLVFALTLGVREGRRCERARSCRSASSLARKRRCRCGGSDLLPLPACFRMSLIRSRSSRSSASSSLTARAGARGPPPAGWAVQAADA